MSSKHNGREQSFPDKQCNQLAFPDKQCNQLGYGNLGELRDDNKLASSEEELKSGEGALISGNSLPGPGLISSWVLGSTSEAANMEHSKRPLCHVGPYQVACKRPKQVEHSRGPNLFEAGECFGHGETNDIPDSTPYHSTNRTCTGSLRLPVYPWHAGGEDRSLDYPSTQLPFFPSHCEDWYRVAGCDQIIDVHRPPFEHLSRKPVAIGTNHQAEVPDWQPQDLQNADPAVSFADDEVIEIDSDKWVRNRVIPMPNPDFAPVIGIINRKIDCMCPDEGSSRCVRQHIMEARENLKRTLGLEKFAMLGFCEMGEDVASRWTEEEEELFREVVLSNPQSMGKDFWDDLPYAFPAKSYDELVSYYFNVFMLQKRAGQNRSGPMDVDSDNDEWQETEDEEEHSVVDSVIERDTATRGKDSKEADLDVEDVEGKPESGCFPAVCCADDSDVQDESCMSFEGQHGGAGSGGQAADELRHGTIANDGLSGITDNGFFDSHCDPKTWDLSFSFGKGDEFLATCSVIEEVIGMEAWENNADDSHGSS